jgi:hypothetical protein
MAVKRLHATHLGETDGLARSLGSSRYSIGPNSYCTHVFSNNRYVVAIVRFPKAGAHGHLTYISFKVKVGHPTVVHCSVVRGPSLTGLPFVKSRRTRNIQAALLPAPNRG